MNNNNGPTFLILFTSNSFQSCCNKSIKTLFMSSSSEEMKMSGPEAKGVLDMFFLWEVRPEEAHWLKRRDTSKRQIRTSSEVQSFLHRSGKVFQRASDQATCWSPTGKARGLQLLGILGTLRKEKGLSAPQLAVGRSLRPPNQPPACATRPSVHVTRGVA